MKKTSSREAKEVLEQRQYVVDQAGERQAVILSMAEYRRLVEDLRDLALIAERRDDETVSFNDLKAELDSLWLTNYVGRAQRAARAEATMRELRSVISTGGRTFTRDEMNEH